MTPRTRGRVHRLHTTGAPQRRVQREPPRVAEEVGDGEELFSEQGVAVFVIVAPIVSIGELKDVDIPVVGGEVSIEDLQGFFVGGGDTRAAGFPNAVEGVFIDFVSDRVELTTSSISEPERGWRFRSRGGERFQ